MGTFIFWLDVEEESRKIYLSGEQLVEDAGKSGISYLGISGNTMIGSWGDTGQKFNGIIDEVQVWDRALTERDATEHGRPHQGLCRRISE